MFRYGNGAGLDLRPYGAGASFARLVAAPEVGIGAEKVSGVVVFSEFADPVG